MNKIISVFFALFLSAGFVHAGDVISGGINDECIEYGYDFGIEKFEYEDGGFFLETNNPDWGIEVTGDDSEADWTADPEVAGVIAKGGQTYVEYAGGTFGTVYSEDLGYGISHITFCGDEEEVPEFGVIAGAAALIGALGIFIYRKH